MNILIAGGTGFIGHALVKHFAKQHTITVLGRDKQKINNVFDSLDVQAIDWQELNKNHIEQQDVVINLCGAPVADRPWSDARKRELLDSRIKPTRTLVELCAISTKKPDLLNANAIGIYGLQNSLPDQLPPALNESTPINLEKEPDFSATIGRRWQKATRGTTRDVRLVTLRFGLVLGDGGIIKKLRLPYRLCLGGPIGDGNQPFSWIALQDVINAIEFIIQNKNIVGPVNITSPNCVTQKAFASAFASHLNRPAVLPLFAFIVKIIFGQLGKETLLQGQHVYPQTLLDNGFEFRYPDLNQALTNITK